MECLGLVREVSPLGGRSLEVTSELRLHQRTPLMSSGRDTRYNASVFKPSGRRRDNGHFDLPQILSDYSNRNGKYTICKIKILSFFVFFFNMFVINTIEGNDFYKKFVISNKSVYNYSTTITKR